MRKRAILMSEENRLHIGIAFYRHNDGLRCCARRIAAAMNARHDKAPAFFWSSWYYAYETMDQQTLEETLAGLKASELPVQFVELDAGYTPTLGDDFDPDSIKNLDDFKAILDRMVASSMEKPTGILKPDWSLAAHYLQHVYEEHADVDAFIQDLYDGKVDLMQDAKFNALMDTFDVLKAYNTFKDSPLSAEDELVHMALSEGQDAFQFGGCWEWNDIVAFDYTGNIGLMPIPQNLEDEFTGKMVVFGSKYFYVDSSENTTDEQRAAREACDAILACGDIGHRCGMTGFRIL